MANLGVKVHCFSFGKPKQEHKGEKRHFQRERHHGSFKVVRSKLLKRISSRDVLKLRIPGTLNFEAQKSGKTEKSFKRQRSVKRLVSRT